MPSLATDKPFIIFLSFFFSLSLFFTDHLLSLQVKLAGKNMASLYKIQHRFTKHKANIHKGAKERAQAQAIAANASKNNTAGNSGGAGGGNRTGGAQAATLAGAAAMAASGSGYDRQFEVESRPSTLSNLSMMTDEVVRDLFLNALALELALCTLS